MIVEQRDYHVFTGKLVELVRLYEEEGIALQQEFLGGLIGVFTTDIGSSSAIAGARKRDGARLKTSRAVNVNIPKARRRNNRLIEFGVIIFSTFRCLPLSRSLVRFSRLLRCVCIRAVTV